MKLRYISSSLALAILIAFVLNVSRVFAVDRYWDSGGADSDWSTAANWADDTEPVSTNDAYLGDATYTNNASANITQAGEVCEVLFMGSVANSTGTITMTSGDLNVTTLRCGYDGVGVFNLNGGVITASSYIVISQNAGSTGTFTQAAGSIVNVNGAGCEVYIAFAGGSVGTYTMNGGKLNVKEIYAGYNGKSTFTQNGGTNTVSGTCRVAGTPGTYTLNSGKLDVGSQLLIANGNYTGSFTQKAGTVVNVPNNYISVGNSHANAVGTYMMNGGELVGDDLSVGGTEGKGTFTQKGGVINVANVNIRYSSPAVGTFQGWGPFNATGQLKMNGRVIADGFGTDHTLIITNYSSFVNNVDNGVAETNGWYAVNNGKLKLKDIAVSAGDNTYYWGEQINLDLINAVKLDLSGCSGSGELSGELYDSAHSSVPEFNANKSKFAGIWKFEANNFTFTSADLTFRYDHSKTGELGFAESDLKVYCHSATDGKWAQITDFGLNTTDKTITASNITSLAYFALGKDIQSKIKRTVITIH